MNSTIVFAVSAIIAIVIGPIVIPIAQRLKIGQVIRSDGPSTHHKKSGTPTMGGVIFLVAILIGALLFTPRDLAAYFFLLSTFSFALIGFLDDYIKVVLSRALGLKARWKIVLQVLFGLVIITIAVFGLETKTHVWFPYWGFIELGLAYYPFALLVIVGTVNAVNLTDGLDGLAAGTVAIALLTFAGLAYLIGEGTAMNFSIIAAGACVGFLLYNWHPARIFMGDTGSLGLGALLAALAIILKVEVLLILIGGIFVIEALSIIIQITSFQLFGRRIFLMSPIHHHFELKGWSEKKIVQLFYYGAVFFGFCSILLVKCFY